MGHQDSSQNRKILEFERESRSLTKSKIKVPKVKIAKKTLNENIRKRVFS